jgi:hypothetical protein
VASGNASTLGKEFLTFFAKRANSSVCIGSIFLQRAPAFFLDLERRFDSFYTFLKNSITLIVNFNQFLRTQLNKTVKFGKIGILWQTDALI